MSQVKKQLRIDDIGASSKIFNHYSWFYPANFGPLKRYWPFRSWGPYQELTATEWKQLLVLFAQTKHIPLVAITATWVEANGTLTAFPEKFPEAAAILKQAYLNNQIVIANHGLTHCVVGKHLPSFWGTNREFHREFWPWLPEHIHVDHIVRSQAILETWLSKPVTVFVPPGNVWSEKTYRALLTTNIRSVSANRSVLDSTEPLTQITYQSDTKTHYVIHDRDIKLRGLPWLRSLLERL